MSEEQERLLSEKLEQLEAGHEVTSCLDGLASEDAASLQLADSLRQLEMPQMSEDTAVAQRASLIRQALAAQTEKQPDPIIPSGIWSVLRLGTNGRFRPVLVLLPILLLFGAFFMFRSAPEQQVESPQNEVALGVEVTQSPTQLASATTSL